MTLPGIPSGGIWNRQKLNHASGRLGEAFLARTASNAVEVLNLGCPFAMFVLKDALPSSAA